MKLFAVSGTNKYRFRRLEALRQLIHDSNKFTVIAQLNRIPAQSVPFKIFPYLDRQTYATFFKTADVIISHGGYGSFLDAIKYQKPILMMPRRQDKKECLDDQLELCEYLESEYGIISLKDPSMWQSKLEDAINVGPPANVLSGALAAELKIILNSWQS